VLLGRAIENRLAEGLYWSKGYTLVPELAKLDTPTLAIHGDADFFPLCSAERIARAMPNAELVVIPDSGHFCHIEAPAALRRAIDAFFADPQRHESRDRTPRSM
jgi:pimeloyl-ACP methyl ester carboxylesterase